MIVVGSPFRNREIYLKKDIDDVTCTIIEARAHLVSIVVGGNFNIIFE
jgi:hypothetical protein